MKEYTKVIKPMVKHHNVKEKSVRFIKLVRGAVKKLRRIFLRHKKIDN